MTETKVITCIECPVGCEITVTLDGDNVISVNGNGCPRGKIYASSEVVFPVRVLTTTVKVEGGGVLPVKTDKPVKKELLFSVMQKVNTVTVGKNTKIGDVIVYNIEDGVNLIATDSVF